MEHKYSLVHLSDITCPPPAFIRAAAEAGYDCVSLRTIPMGLAGEIPHDIAKDRGLFRETKRAVEETGIVINDTENARIFAGVNIRDYEPAWKLPRSLASARSSAISGSMTGPTIRRNLRSSASWPGSTARR